MWDSHLALELLKALRQEVLPHISREPAPHLRGDDCYFPRGVPLSCLFRSLGLNFEAHWVLRSTGADIHFHPDLVSMSAVNLLVEIHG